VKLPNPNLRGKPLAKRLKIAGSKPPHDSQRVIFIGTAALILLLFATVAAFAMNLRQRELRDQERQLTTLGKVLVEQAERSFQSVNLVISSVAETAAAGVTDDASLTQKMIGHEVYLLLRAKIEGTPQIDAVTVFDRQGKMLNSSRTWPTPEIDISDRAFFRLAKADRNLKNYITEPLQNRDTGAWTIYLVHRISGEGGEFLGLILGAIQMQYFEDFYRAISLGEGDSIALRREDGVTLARFPQSDEIGKMHSDAEHLLGGGVSSTVREASLIDGTMRIKATHRLSDFHLIVVASGSEQIVLAGWRAMAFLLAMGALGCAIAITLAGFMLARHWKEQAQLLRAHEDLRRLTDQTGAMATAARVAEATAFQMVYAAEHDVLTGLPNRLLLNDRIGQAIAFARRHKRRVALLFLDLDGFKHVNDSLGHMVGDKLLQSVASRLVSCVRGSDTVSRQGGDEFVVLLAQVEELEDAAVTASRIAHAVTGLHSIEHGELHVHAATAAGLMLDAVAEPHSVERHQLYVTASIGVSVFPDDGADAETLIKNADTAMYQAKEGGRRDIRCSCRGLLVMPQSRHAVGRFRLMRRV